MVWTLTRPKSTTKKGDCEHCKVAKNVTLFVFYDHEESPPTEHLGCEGCAFANYNAARAALDDDGAWEFANE